MKKSNFRLLDIFLISIMFCYTIGCSKDKTSANELIDNQPNKTVWLSINKKTYQPINIGTRKGISNTSKFSKTDN